MPAVRLTSPARYADPHPLFAKSLPLIDSACPMYVSEAPRVSAPHASARSVRVPVVGAFVDGLPSVTVPTTLAVPPTTMFPVKLANGPFTVSTDAVSVVRLPYATASDPPVIVDICPTV